MEVLLSWASANPGAFASLVSAVIAASVALIVFALTQFFARKRERAEFLTPKLEALYTLLNEVAQWNARVCDLGFRAADGDKEALKTLESVDHLELYGHQHAKSIIMYIRLYFPKLSPIHQRLFRAQAELNRLMFELQSDKPPKLPEVVEAGGEVGHFLRLMEAEIINNRDSLIGDRVLPRRFRASSDDEIENMIPPPEGPLWARSDRTARLSTPTS